MCSSDLGAFGQTSRHLDDARITIRKKPRAEARGHRAFGPTRIRMAHRTVHHAESPGSRRLTKCVRAFIFVTVPTILRIRGYRIGFFQADLAEPPHVHVRRQSGEAKFWLDTIAVAGSRGFRPHEIREIATILEDHKNDLMAAWYAEEAKRGDSSGENSDG